eukprot:3461130-Amphidinium_carterae.1
MKWLQQQTNVEDRAVPDPLLSGLPIVGKGISSPFFVDMPTPPVIPLQHLLMGRPSTPQKVGCEGPELSTARCSGTTCCT